MDRNVLLSIIFSALFVFLVLYFDGIGDGSVDDYQKNNILEKQNSIVENNDKKSFVDKNSKKSIFNKNDIDKKSSLVNLKPNVYPVDGFKFSVGDNFNKLKTFDVSNKSILVSFSNIDASIKNIKLINYQDVDGDAVDVVFNKNASNNNLSTSFIRAEKLSSKLQNVYSYAIYDCDFFSGKINIYDEGSLAKLAKGYNDLIKLHLDRLSKKYYSGDNIQSGGRVKVVFFRSEYFVGSNSNVIEVFKLFSIFENQYLIDVNFIVNKLSGDNIHVRSNDSTDSDRSVYFHWGKGLGPYFDVNKASSYDQAVNTSYLDISSSHSEEKISELNNYNISNFKWISIDSRYLLLSIIPDWNINDRNQKIWDLKGYSGEIYQGNLIKSSGLFSSGFIKEKIGNEVIGISFKDFILNKDNPSKSISFTLFTGPKNRSLLNEDFYADFELSLVRDRSWVPFIKPLEWGIEWFLFKSYQFTGNFGLSIILLTILLKILLNPLTKRSLESSGKMAEFAPKIKEIEKQYKNKPQEKQKAIMELYKREKINPLSGCLPLLLQAPVFYALWSVFPSILDLKSASFLWINDLSSPDTVAKIDLFFTENLNILPIIMSLTFIFQSKLMPQSNLTMPNANSVQSATMMKYLLPIIFLFVFWSMPSGLVLYWTVQNILQITQQLYINWKKSTVTNTK